ncbi:kinase-like protein [Laetiporus sulphureus 93-53]|uniref:Kinase-like protein n=1 Tax=Laetiporus sulphureus 93-53 TaxID=1314785 RepID=A0A165EVQ5_9APHY|nr:kinase-like protein [Laetiporus sulphureus 93-53]KZT07864.1 kinase-like protein [Laetiporus sulphureus 93-53]
MFRTMRKLCEKHVVLPRASLLSPHELIVEDEHPIDRGGFGEIRRGQWQSGGSIVRVAFKSFTFAQNEDLQQQIYKEAIQWRHLHHPNVVPFFGVCDMPRPLRLCIVSHWMENGSIMDFLRQNTSADRLPLLVGIATGLEYLHSKDIVHGDLKGANILIDDNGVPRLADFGLATVVYRMQTVNTASESHRGGTYRWMAPELFDPEKFGLPHVRPSKESDVYGLAMVMWEVYTGRIPFHMCRNEWQVVYKIMSGKRPTRSEDTMLPVIQDRIWILMEECWDACPGNRPNVRDVLGRLGAEDDMHGITVTEQNRVSPHMRTTSEHSSVDMQTLNIREDSGSCINVHLEMKHVECHLRITARFFFFFSRTVMIGRI